MLSPVDHYTALDLPDSPLPSRDEVVLSYRRLTKQWHPDVNQAPEAAERFTQITLAYKVLGDPDRRARYDARRAGMTGTNPVPRDKSRVISKELTRVLSRRKKQNGADVAMQLPLRLRDMIRGGVHAVEYQRLVLCAACGGEGREDLTGSVACSSCSGTGRVGMSTRTGIRIRAGVRPGDKLTFTGLGHSGMHGGIAGHVLVAITLAAAPGVRVADGVHVEQVLVCSFAQLQHDLPVTLSLPDGQESHLMIPAKTQPGHQWILPENGLVRPDGSRGEYRLCLALDLSPELPLNAERIQAIATAVRERMTVISESAPSPRT